MISKGHLQDKDRELIYLFLNQGYSMRDIGAKIGRDHTVVAREVERNKGPDGKYQPFEAHKMAIERRAQANRENPLKHPKILRYVKEKLQDKWSPEQISGRIMIDLPGLSVSHETIYKYIYSKETKNLTLWVYLRRKKSKRVVKGGRKVYREFVPNRIFIDERPKHIELREEIGHWESDLMEGVRSSKGAVSVNTERKSRFVILRKVESKGSLDKAESTISGMSNLPHWLRRSITFDNGTENAKHEVVAKALHLNTYFCHAYHFWEKGSVENSIGFIREYIPKKTDMKEIDQRILNLVAKELNDRPRKCLNYLTPYEVLSEELSGAFWS